MSTIRITHTDGAVETFAASAVTEKYAMAYTCEDHIHTITLTPTVEGLSLTAVEYVMDIPVPLLSPVESLRFFDNAQHTVDPAHVFSYAQHREHEIKDLTVFKNLSTKEVWLVGLLTAHRFWTSMFLKDNTLTIRYEMEDRILNRGEDYVMERFTVTGGTDNENALLEAYADGVAALNHARPEGKIPVGFCSWSCYYNDVNEENIRRAADMQVRYAPRGIPNLIQIDLGWMAHDDAFFTGDWVENLNKFPEGLRATADYVRERGMDFGLWVAPVTVSQKSPFFETVKAFVHDKPSMNGGTTFPFELGDPRYHDHLRRAFSRMKEEYHATYFKLDFLSHAIRDCDHGDVPMKFKDGFCVELLRGVLQTIRDTVGDDVTILACGVQTLIGAGILNASRMSCDIIWGKHYGYPTHWEIMQNCVRSISMRYFYHRKVFINDADGIVLRDFDRGDGFNATWSEVELWAITVAMSGGYMLSNDELENLSPARRELYTSLLPPMDQACRPVDFFEEPNPTAHILPVDEDTCFLALYHFGDKMEPREFDLGKIGMDGAMVYDCRAKKVLGFRDKITVDAMPHSAFMFLLRRLPDTPDFLCSDANIYGGINLIFSNFDGETLTVTRPAAHKDAKIWTVYPEGFTPVGEVVLTDKGYTVTLQ